MIVTTLIQVRYVYIDACNPTLIVVAVFIDRYMYMRVCMLTGYTQVDRLNSGNNVPLNDASTTEVHSTAPQLEVAVRERGGEQNDKKCRYAERSPRL